MALYRLSKYGETIDTVWGDITMARMKAVRYVRGDSDLINIHDGERYVGFVVKGSPLGYRFYSVGTKKFYNLHIDGTIAVRKKKQWRPFGL